MFMMVTNCVSLVGCQFQKCVMDEEKFLFYGYKKYKGHSAPLPRDYSTCKLFLDGH